MRILFLTDGPQVPSGRFRVEQFVPHLEARGISCTVRYAYGTAYNEVSRKPWGSAYKLVCRLRRAAHTVAAGDYDLVFLQRTAIPLTAVPELIRARLGGRFVFDFDDAIYLGPGGRESRWRAQTFRRAIDLCDQVIAGNQHLAHQAAVPEKTTVIPTVVDTEVYVPPPQRVPHDEVVIGWMGTASNFDSLRTVIPDVMRALERIPRGRFRIVSNARLPELEGNPRVEQVRWSPHEEVRQLQSFDIGLMPLQDTPLTWGKCGFKMIQYMAVGTPVVASAVGANPDIFAGSGAGHLPRPGEDWTEPLIRLALDPAARRQAGDSGRRHVVRSYSVNRVVEQLTEVFSRALAAPPKSRDAAA